MYYIVYMDELDLRFSSFRLFVLCVGKNEVGEAKEKASSLLFPADCGRDGTRHEEETAAVEYQKYNYEVEEVLIISNSKYGSSRP